MSRALWSLLALQKNLCPWWNILKFDNLIFWGAVNTTLTMLEWKSVPFQHHPCNTRNTTLVPASYCELGYLSCLLIPFVCQYFIWSLPMCMCLPSGWIHAVYTPKDSLVFGGNFLNCFNISQQLQVAMLENKLKVREILSCAVHTCSSHWFACCLVLVLKCRHPVSST